MSVPEPLRDSNIQIVKRMSLQNILSNLGRSAPMRPTDIRPHYPALKTTEPVGQAHYMPGLPKQYTPNPGFTETPQNNYQPYDMSRDISALGPRQANNRPSFDRSKYEDNSSDGNVKYDDSLLTDELFQLQMELLREQAENQTEDAIDIREITQQIVTTMSEEGSFDVNNMSYEEMNEIRLAVAQAVMENSKEPGLQFADEVQYEQIEEQIENSLEFQSQTLDDVIENEEVQDEAEMSEDVADMLIYGDLSMAEKCIDQQMEEVAESVEPYPDQMQGYDMMAQEMYDEQMEDMMYELGPDCGP